MIEHLELGLSQQCNRSHQGDSLVSCALRSWCWVGERELTQAQPELLAGQAAACCQQQGTQELLQGPVRYRHSRRSSCTQGNWS